MGRKKTAPLSFILSVIILAATLVSSSYALSWESWTSFNQVRRVRQIGDSVYFATSGGLLAIPTSEPGSLPSTYTNLDGLGTVDITDVIADSAGQIWVTGFGQLVRFGSENFKRFPTAPEYGSEIGLFCVVDGGDNLWIGSDSGLIWFAKAGVEDGFYRDKFQITEVNGYPSVNDVMVLGNAIWIATASGLATADKSSPGALKYPSAWRLFDMSSNPELGTNNIKRVVHFEDSIYVITADSLFRMSVLGVDTSFVGIDLGAGRTPNDLKVEDSLLIVYHTGGYSEIFEGTITFFRPTSPGPVTGLDVGTYRWLAFGGNIGMLENSSGVYLKYSYSGIPGDQVSDIAIDANGIISAGFSDQRSATRDPLTDSWSIHDYQPGRATTILELDKQNRLWVGTVGGGLWRVVGDSLSNYNDTNSTVVGNNDLPPSSYLWAWVTGVHFVDNYLLASVFRAYNGNPVAVARLDSEGYAVEWDSFGVADGITDIDLVSLDYYNGVMAVGSRNRGLFYCRIGPDPFDKSDDFCINYTTDNSLILSDLIRAVAFSPGGELWAVTNFGVSRLDTTLGQAGQIGRWVDVRLPDGMGPDVTAIEFDGRGNAWIGAQNGLARIPPMPEHEGAFTRQNSGLLDNRITSLTVGGQFGDLYISTPSGISILKNTTGSVTDNLDELHVRPNPFVIGSSDDCLEFPFAKDFAVHIFNVAGEPVWESTDLGQPCWNGRNQHGRPVAAGVYLFVLKDVEGNMARGKFLLVRQ